MSDFYTVFLDRDLCRQLEARLRAEHEEDGGAPFLWPSTHPDDGDADLDAMIAEQEGF